MTPPPKYWGGLSARSTSRIAPLPARTFKELVDKFVCIPHPLPYTREAFFALPQEERNRLKDGPYLTTGVFRESVRNDTNLILVHTAFLDLDGGPEAKRYAESPDVLAEDLFPLNFAAWHTANSTPEAPRLRVMLDLVPSPETTPLKAYLQATVRLAMKRLGLKHGFKGYTESTTASQAAYRPVSFIGEDTTSPVIAMRTNGIAADPAEAPPPDEEEKHFNYAYNGDAELFLSLSHLPVTGLTVESLREPLFRIDPDITYRVWVGVIAAFKHQFRDEDEAREAFHLVDEWSSTGTKYKDGECLRKWKSYRPDPKGRAPVTIRSVFKLAMDAGWENTRLATKIKVGVEEWIKGCEDCELLLSEGAKRIAEMPFRNELVEEALVLCLRARIKELSNTVLDKATIRKQVSMSRFKAKKEDTGGAGLEGWLQKICYITTSNVFRNVGNGVEYIPAAFDNTFSIHLMPADDDSDLAKAGKPSILPTHYALNVRNITRVDGVTYDPRQCGIDPFFDHDGRKYVNLYRIATAPAPDPANSRMAGRWLRRLLRVLVADEGYERILLDYFAFVVQNPGQKVRWFPLIQAVQGAGKGTLSEFMEAALGAENCLVVAPGAMASDFTSWKAGYQWVVFNELRSAGQNRHEIYNKVKDAITDEKVCINQKFRDPRVEQNITNYFACTNFKDSLHLEDGDRRCFPIHSPLQRKEQVKALHATGFFKDLHDVTTKFPGAIRHYLLHHEISPDFPVNGPAPETRYHAEMVEDSKNHLQIAIEGLIEEGSHPAIGRDVVMLSELVNLTMVEARNNNPPKHYLSLIGYERYDNGKHYSINGERSQIWVNPAVYDPNGMPAEEILRKRVK